MKRRLSQATAQEGRLFSKRLRGSRSDLSPDLDPFSSSSAVPAHLSDEDYVKLSSNSDQPLATKAAHVAGPLSRPEAPTLSLLHATRASSIMSPSSVPSVAPDSNAASLGSQVLQEARAAVDKLQIATERGDANILLPLKIALVSLVNLGNAMQARTSHYFWLHINILQGQWDAERVLAVFQTRVNAFVEIATATMADDDSDTCAESLQNRLRAISK